MAGATVGILDVRSPTTLLLQQSISMSLVGVDTLCLKPMAPAM